MTFVDMEITRRHFAARYRNVGRAMLAELADDFGVDRDVADNWADAIDRETDIQPKIQADFETVASRPRFPSGGDTPAGAACTPASASYSYPVGSRRGSGVAAVPPAAAAPATIQGDRA